MQQIYEFTSNWQAISRTIMLFCACLLFSLFSSAQNSNVRITIKNKNISVIEALKEVEKQARLSVGYNESQLKTKPSIALSLEKATLESALTVILKETGYTYQLQGQHILIVPQEKRQGTGTPKRVTGCVTDEEGEPLIGVNVHVEGTGAGTITDIDGNFVLEVATGNTLRFTYVGYTSQTVKVGGQNSYNVQLASDTKQLNEVVVTALGIKRATKALSYNVQEVKAADITSNKDANFVNALSGKVAGVNINSSSSGVGGISKVVMRGTKSIMQSSNALYVIDGVPMFSSGNSGGSTEFGSQGTTEPIADINPEDIESMSVLTGAAAAALYGSDAANGAIVITTKKGKEGRVSISFNSNTEFTNPLVLPMFQTRYGTGSAVNGKDAIDRSWGEHLTVANYQGYNPRSDYFQTGVISTESVSFSTGTDKNQTYASASALNSKGIVPNNKYTRYNFTARNTTKFLNDKMTFDFGTNYIRQEDRNMVNQGTYNNPIVGAYIFPRGNDWEEIKAYERYNVARKIYIQYWPMGDAGMTVQNPYWVNYRNLRENKKDRYMMNANLAYQVLEWLTVSGRVRIDHSSNDYTERFFATTNNQLTMGSNNGSYDIIKSTDKQLYADFLLNANKNLGEDWSLQASFGGSFSDMRSNSLQVIGPIADGSIEGERTGLPNFFAVQNLRVSQTQHMQAGWREQTQSLFASAELGYKSTYYLTLTGRNDWPSQLAGPKSTNSSFFYPSAGLSVVLSELMPKVNKDYLSYLKLRASYASVGVAFKRYLANPQNSWNSAGGTWSLQTNYPIYDLKPERTKSFEVGLSMKFLKDFNLDVTYYNSKTMNQTFDPKLGVSGWSTIYIQTGAVRNEGLELSLGFSKTWNKFTWNTGYTFSTNRNKILTLADNAINPATGERFSLSTLDMSGLGETCFLLKEGGSMGDLYSKIDLRRDENGRIYVDENGDIATSRIEDVNRYIKLGSVLPKANMAWNNTFSWNNFKFSFLVSARLGGVVFSNTQAILDSYGVSEVTAAARDLGYVAINNGDKIMPEKWYTVTGGVGIPQYYTYLATNVRLQEASLSYTFPRKMLHNACDITVAVNGRNLWMIYNKAPFDPESVASTDNFYQGIDHFIMPSLRNVGFSLNVKF